MDCASQEVNGLHSRHTAQLIALSAAAGAAIAGIAIYLLRPTPARRRGRQPGGSHDSCAYGGFSGEAESPDVGQSPAAYLPQ